MTRGVRLATMSVVAAMSASLMAAAQAPTFSARTRAVRIDVLATSGGRPVTGLGADDFEVRENGVVQQVELVSFDEVPLTLVLALDVSDSVSGERLTHLRQADGRGCGTFATTTSRRSSRSATPSSCTAASRATVRP